MCVVRECAQILKLQTLNKTLILALISVLCAIHFNRSRSEENNLFLFHVQTLANFLSILVSRRKNTITTTVPYDELTTVSYIPTPRT